MGARGQLSPALEAGGGTSALQSTTNITASAEAVANSFSKRAWNFFVTSKIFLNSACNGVDVPVESVRFPLVKSAALAN